MREKNISVSLHRSNYFLTIKMQNMKGSRSISNMRQIKLRIAVSFSVPFMFAQKMPWLIVRTSTCCMTVNVNVFLLYSDLSN